MSSESEERTAEAVCDYSRPCWDDEGWTEPPPVRLWCPTCRWANEACGLAMAHGRAEVWVDQAVTSEMRQVQIHTANTKEWRVALDAAESALERKDAALRRMSEDYEARGENWHAERAQWVAERDALEARAEELGEALESLEETIHEHLSHYGPDDGTDDKSTPAECVEYAGAEIKALARKRDDLHAQVHHLQAALGYNDKATRIAALEAEVRRKDEALALPHHQGGHSKIGAAIRAALSPSPEGWSEPKEGYEAGLVAGRNYALEEAIVAVERAPYVGKTAIQALQALRALKSTPDTAKARDLTPEESEAYLDRLDDLCSPAKAVLMTCAIDGCGKAWPCADHRRPRTGLTTAVDAPAKAESLLVRTLHAELDAAEAGPPARCLCDFACPPGEFDARCQNPKHYPADPEPQEGK